MGDHGFEGAGEFASHDDNFHCKPSKDPVFDLRQAVHCLYLEVLAAIVDDVRDKAEAVIALIDSGGKS